MSFGKLLATGKSIISGRRGAAYRENRRVYLPKFESPKNPFAKAGLPASVASRTPAAGQAVAPALVPAKPPSRPTHWAKLNPISMFLGSAPVRPVVAVQAELSLDTVKVIQNDLSNDEVEVVPLKSRPPRPPADGPGEPGEAWNDLGAKVFGANAV